MKNETIARDVEGVVPAAEAQIEPDHVSVVTRLFAETFDLDSVAPDDNFFHLGGDSLVAATLMAAVEREFGTALSISALLESPTPRALGERVLAAIVGQSDDALVVAQGEGSGPPVCCVHNMRGVTWFPQTLVEGLSGARPIYGFRAIGLHAGEWPLETVEQIARNYLAALRRTRGGGPYVLLGECGGALVAYEMAQQLAAAGESVAGLILVDPLASERVAPYLFNSGLSLKLVQQRWVSRAKMVQAQVDRKPEMSREARDGIVRDAMFAAVGSYTPRPFAGETLLLYTTAQRDALLDPQRGFPSLLPNCETVEVKARHQEISRHKPELIAAIAPFLDRVAPLPQ